MPSDLYQKNKQYALAYNAKNKERIREINRINKRKYDTFWREFKRLSFILLPIEP
jgi:DNA replication protein DnaD